MANSKRTKAKQDPTAWRYTEKARETYTAAKLVAQARANETGFDHGIEWNDVFKACSVRMLPSKQHRSGSELRCEVVMCSDISKCQKGHGPCA